MASRTADLSVDSPAEAQPSAPVHAPSLAYAPSASPTSGRALLPAFFMPIAAAVALAVHYFLPDSEPTPTTNFYRNLLVILFFATLAPAILQLFSLPVRRWLSTKAPLFTVAILLLCAWQLITLKLALLPLPYFPSPELVFQALVEDRRLLFDCTWHSLFLLLSGYFLGVLAGLFSGICMGWSSRIRYWGMPVLKIIGPIPAVAWIPLAMVTFNSAFVRAAVIIALAVWFPITMLTASGISNVRVAYLDVAKTLGANRFYLIFRVAIPAALPSIFIGLFMGLGTSFLTLIVAEGMGVKPGLGWYIDWMRNYSEWAKIFAALLIMSVFFSSIMTLLFAIRDRVLVWQKGVIKW
jgi:NitT/TauT family transport system permease protein